MFPSAYAAGQEAALEKFAILDTGAALRQAHARAQAAGRTELARNIENRAVFGAPSWKLRQGTEDLAQQAVSEVAARKRMPPTLTPAKPQTVYRGIFDPETPAAPAAGGTVGARPRSMAAPAGAGPQMLDPTVFAAEPMDKTYVRPAPNISENKTFVGKVSPEGQTFVGNVPAEGQTQLFKQPGRPLAR